MDEAIIAIVQYGVCTNCLQYYILSDTNGCACQGSGAVMNTDRIRDVYAPDRLIPLRAGRCIATAQCVCAFEFAPIYESSRGIG